MSTSTSITSAASVLADIGHVLESLDDPGEQLEHVLQLVDRCLPYHRCSLLDAHAVMGRGLLVVPAPPAEERDLVRRRLSELYDLLAGETAPRSRRLTLPDAPHDRTHLAVPIIALDQVEGIVMVEREVEPYDEHHLQILSVVAAHIGGYLAKVRLLAEKTKSTHATRRAARLLERIMDGYLEFDADGTCVTANRSAAELLGIDRAQLIGASANDVLSMDENQSFVRAFRKVLDEGVSVRLDAVYTEAGDRWWEGDLYPTEIGVSVFMRDISERRRAEEFRDLLVGIIGHDLGTPLGAITLTAETLLHRGGLDEATARSIARIARSGARINEMVTQLLDLTRIRLGKTLPIRRRRANLGRICRQVVDELSRMSPGREIQMDLSGDLDGRWDADRLAQVVSNLLANAVKYGTPGTPIQLRAWDEDEVVHFQVHNEGPPIPADLMPSTFQAFRRGDRSDPEKSGMGFGLFIVRTIVDEHDGSIEVISTLEHGTTFDVRLPRGVEGVAAQSSSTREGQGA